MGSKYPGHHGRPGVEPPTTDAQISASHNELQSDEGATAVEFALILVPFLLLAFGIISFGWVFAQQQILNHAVREGARAAVVVSAQTSVPDVEAIVIAASGGIMPLGSGDVVTSGTCGSGTPSDITVSVTDKSVNSLVAFPPIPAQFNLSAKAVFRCEW